MPSAPAPETLEYAKITAHLTRQDVFLFYGMVKRVRGWNLQDEKPNRSDYFRVDQEGNITQVAS